MTLALESSAEETTLGEQGGRDALKESGARRGAEGSKGCWEAW